jgi:hypothetical protein
MKHFALVAALLITSPALAGSLTVTVAETGQTTQSKTYTVADADVDKVVATYQSGANVSVNGTATRAQVLLYWLQTVLVIPTQQAVQQFETPAPVVPGAISIQ